MSREYKKEPGTIRIFPNKMKKQSSHPDAIGTFIDQDGKEHEIVLWKILMKNGGFFMGGKCTPMDEAMKNRKEPPKKNNFKDLPF